MSNRPIRRGTGAILLFAAGALLLLMNLGIITLEWVEIWNHFYMFIFLLAGLYYFVTGFRRIFGMRMFAGFLLLAIGSLLLLDRLGYFPFQLGMAWKLWPIGIIFIALRMMFKPKRFTGRLKAEVDWEGTGRADPDAQKDRREIEDAIDSSYLIRLGRKKENQGGHSRMKKMFTIGSLELNKDNWSLEPITMYKTIGDYHIDLGKAFIPDGTTPIILSGWIGNVEILVPEDIPIRVSAEVSIGEITVLERYIDSSVGSKVEYESPSYKEAKKKIDFSISLSIGDVKIKKV